MAKLIPSGVVNLPNFAELQYNLNERERQKQLQFDEWSSQFQKKAGTYLDGDKEAVQTAYTGVEKALKDLARDPDSIELRRKVREANASYNEVAGSALFNADNYRQQWTAYNADPDKFSVSGQEAVELFNRERTSKRDANQIMSLASNPFTLMPKYKYDLMGPAQVGKEYEDLIRKNIFDYTRQDGSVDTDKVRKAVTDAVNARYIDPEQTKNAIIYSGVKDGSIGRNGQITSRADLDILNTEDFAPKGKEGLRLSENFKGQIVESVMKAIPKMAVNPVDLRLQQQKLALEYAKLREKGGDFPRLQIRQGDVQSPIQVKYVPPTRPNENNQIVHKTAKPIQSQFTAQAVIDIPSGSMPKYLDPATGEEFKINKIMYDLEGSPYFLRSFEQKDLTDQSKNAFDVVEVNQEILGSFSKADRQFLNSVLVPAKNAVPSQQGFSLEEYIKEKDL
jgi:hypothetical protein